MSKHTPGPWTQDEYGDVITPNRKTLVTEGIALGGRSTPETRANARLIAAAPELLAMLKDLVDLEGPQPGNSAWGDRALALIAKVEGEMK